MRFSFSITVTSDNEVRIPVSYRKNFLSLIKEALKPGGNESEFFNKYYSNDAKRRNTPKPFTFSVHIPVRDLITPAGGEKYFLLKTNVLNFHFSSCDTVLLLHAYNGFVGLNGNRGFSVFRDCKMELGNFHLKPAKKFDGGAAVFKPYSPILVRKADLQRKGEKTAFISQDEAVLKKLLFNNMKFLNQNFLDPHHTLKTEDVEITFPGGIKMVPAPTYGGEIGIRGWLEIKAPDEILQLIYDVGIGAKRSQGYGMLEVVK